MLFLPYFGGELIRVRTVKLPPVASVAGRTHPTTAIEQLAGAMPQFSCACLEEGPNQQWECSRAESSSPNLSSVPRSAAIHWRAAPTAQLHLPML